ncbi:hypothetical protein FERRO_00950 [Ferrovum sp. JA12]|nr:hypothetical protein FERRO_00950 [Ferrovum sp. JA12]
MRWHLAHECCMQNIICLLQNEVLYSSLRQTLDQEQAMGAVAEREVTASQDRGALAKMVMTLLDHWRLSTEDQAALLGIATSNRAALSNYRSGKPIGTSRDQYERVGHLLGIHKNLRLLFPQNRDLAYRWMTTRNKAFDNLTPVEVVKEWGFAGLLMVRGYLDRARGV